MGPPLLPLLFENGCPPPEAGLGVAGASGSPPSGELCSPYRAGVASSTSTSKRPSTNTFDYVTGWAADVARRRRAHRHLPPGPDRPAGAARRRPARPRPRGDLRLMASGGQRSVAGSGCSPDQADDAFAAGGARATPSPGVTDDPLRFGPVLDTS